MRELEKQMRAMRCALIQAMGEITRETPKEELRRVCGFWKRFQTEVEDRGDAIPDLEPGESQDFIEFVWTTPEWKNFDKVRTWSHQQDPEYKAAKKKYDASEARVKYFKEYEASPKRKLSAALRARMKYHGVTRPEDLPERSVRGRKAKVAS